MTAWRPLLCEEVAPPRQATCRIGNESIAWFTANRGKMQIGASICDPKRNHSLSGRPAGALESENVLLAMVEVIYDGNLGNQLFQYSFGRLLAERLGYRLVAPSIPGFPRTCDRVMGASHPDGEVVVLRGQKPDLQKVLDNHGRGLHVLLTGYFQRSEYYQPHVQRIRGWLQPEGKVDVRISPDDVVLSIRRGRDYIPQYGLPLSYYEEALGASRWRGSARVH